MTFTFARACLAIGIVAALFVWPSRPAAANDEPGQLSARSLAPVTLPLTIGVVPDDNTRTNTALAGRMTQELGRRGYGVGAADSPFVLRFDTETRSNVAGGAPSYSRELSGAAESATSVGIAGPPDQREEVANVLSSEGRGMIGPRRESRYERALRHVINMRLADERTGAIVWQGHAQYDADQADAETILNAMAPLLIAEIGRTVRDRRFVLD